MVLYHLTSPQGCPCCFKQLSRLDQALRLTVDSFIDGQECNLELHHWMWCCSGRRNMLNWSWRVVPQPRPFSYDIGYGNDIACICKHILYFIFLCFVVFCGPNVDVSLFPANDGCGVSWCPVEATRRRPNGICSTIQRLRWHDMLGGEGCLRRSGKISQAADSLSSTWVEELPAGWVCWCSWLGWHIVTHQVVTHSDDAELYRYVVIWVIRLPISYKWYKTNRW